MNLCPSARMGVQTERVASRGTGCTERSGGSWAEAIPKCARGKAPSSCDSDRHLLAETTGSVRNKRIGRGPNGKRRMFLSNLSFTRLPAARKASRLRFASRLVFQVFRPDVCPPRWAFPLMSCIRVDELVWCKALFSLLHVHFDYGQCTSFTAQIPASSTRPIGGGANNRRNPCSK